MSSRYMESLQGLAIESDQDRRLELAAAIDRDAEELNDVWAVRDDYQALEAARNDLQTQLDEMTADRDSWQQRYADRFFDGPDPNEGTATTIVDDHKDDIIEETKPQTYDELWASMED